MDPEKKQLIIMLGIVGVLLVVVGLLIFWPETSVDHPQPLLAKEGGTPPLNKGRQGGVSSVVTPTSDLPPATYNLTPKTSTPPTPDQQDSAAMLASARSFAELFGTYSSEAASFSTVNLADLATPSFQKWYAGAWQKLRAGFPKGYYSITTRALSTNVLSHDAVAGKASVEVQTQQEEVGSQVSGVSYRTLQFELVRVEGRWLVERASWK